jgi:hypothetical protein
MRTGLILVIPPASIRAPRWRGAGIDPDHRTLMLPATATRGPKPSMVIRSPESGGPPTFTTSK